MKDHHKIAFTLVVSLSIFAALLMWRQSAAQMYADILATSGMVCASDVGWDYPAYPCDQSTALVAAPVIVTWSWEADGSTVTQSATVYTDETGRFVHTFPRVNEHYMQVTAVADVPCGSASIMASEFNASQLAYFHQIHIGPCHLVYLPAIQ